MTLPQFTPPAARTPARRSRSTRSVHAQMRTYIGRVYGRHLDPCSRASVVQAAPPVASEIPAKVMLAPTGGGATPDGMAYPVLLPYLTPALIDSYGLPVPGGPAPGDDVHVRMVRPRNPAVYGRFANAGAAPLPFVSRVDPGKGIASAAYGTYPVGAIAAPGPVDPIVKGLQVSVKTATSVPAGTAGGLDFNVSTGGVGVSLAATGGLDVTAGLKVKQNTAPATGNASGLDVSGSGVGVSVDPNGAIGLASGVAVKPDNGISVSATGVAVKPDNGIAVSASGVAVKQNAAPAAGNASGLDVTSGGVGVSLKATNSGLTLAGPGLAIDHTAANTWTGTQVFDCTVDIGDGTASGAAHITSTGTLVADSVASVVDFHACGISAGAIRVVHGLGGISSYDGLGYPIDTAGGSITTDGGAIDLGGGNLNNVHNGDVAGTLTIDAGATLRAASITCVIDFSACGVSVAGLSVGASGINMLGHALTGVGTISPQAASSVTATDAWTFSGVVTIGASGTIQAASSGTTVDFHACGVRTGSVTLESASTGTSAPANGSAGALPANPNGYLNILINGSTRAIPYW